MEDWKGMLNFALDLVQESKISRAYSFIDERMAILHLDHAIELLMKAFLIEKGYFIYYIDKNDLKKGVKEKDLFDISKTMSYIDCLDLVCRKINFETDKKEKVKKFHNIRNEIQHRALNLPLDKGKEIRNFYPLLKELYEKMFPDFERSFPIFNWS